MSQPADGDFYRKKYMISIAYIVGILLFLLPFAEIRCNNESFAENTGVGLAFGTDYKVTGQIKAFTDSFGNTRRSSRSTRETGKFYVVALIALALGILGAVLSFVYNRASTTNMIVAALAAISLIILAIQLKADVSEHTRSSNFEDTVANGIVVTVNFTPWYYLSVISFLVAAFLSFKFRPDQFIHETPPKNAPQVPINNPGDQSEFPSSPEEEEMER